jgi:hypothetical protein
MKSARKHREGWDDASYIMRGDPERPKKSRPSGAGIEVPQHTHLDLLAAIRAWRAIGLKVSAEQILRGWSRITAWQFSLPRGRTGADRVTDKQTHNQ